MRRRSEGWGRSGVRGTTRAAVLALVASFVGAVAVTPAPPAAAAPTRCPAGDVALTFDDGPAGVHTGRVLDVLAGRGVRATFFVTGSRVVDRPSLIARMAREGHEVANHTYAHDRLTDLSEEQIRRTVDRTDRAIRAAGAPALRLVRPPGGATSTRVQDVLARAGYGHVTWTIDPQDWRTSATTSGIRSHVLGRLHPGANILLHDGSPNAPDMIAALPGIVDGARERGYCFATLDERGRLVRSDGSVFRDVSPTSVHGPAIARLAELGIARGCGDGKYCPSGLVTRAQMASFLQRALGLPAGPEDGFVDVAPGSAHASAIGALAAAGVTVGCTDDGRSYCPNEDIRRDQMASLLQRAFVLPPGREDRFGDVVPGSTHAAAIGAVHEAGITVGCTPDGRSYCPAAPVDRAQMASLLVRALDRPAS
jgi:peptidoglycan/xylan/chitin deacetylase (PgdA/CDA1 family)